MDHLEVSTDFLKQVDIFRNFSEKEIAQLKSILTPAFFDKDTEILREGDLGNSLYIVVTGNISVNRRKNDEDIISFSFSSGDIIGEFALIEEVPRTATAVAETDVFCYQMQRRDFLQITENNPKLGLFLLQELSKKMRTSADAFTSVLQKKNRELKETYDELKMAHQELKQLDVAKTNFIKLVTHELVTPMNVFQSSLQLIQLKTQDNTLKKYAQMITNKAMRLSNQIRQIIELTQAKDFDYQRYPFQSCSISDILHEFEEEFLPLFVNRNITFNKDVEIIEDTIECIPHQLSQVLEELFYNAIRFTDDGGKVSLFIRTDDRVMILTCEDTGIGIPNDKLEKIFEPFYEAISIDHHTSGGIEFLSSGMGLGLSIVSNNIDTHHGRLWIRSIEGGGTKITIVFPLKQDHALVQYAIDDMKEISMQGNNSTDT